MIQMKRLIKAYKKTMEAFRKRELRLLKDYRGEYVVLVRGKVVDHDEDLQKLGKRIIGKYPLDRVYITNIGTPRRGLIVEV